VAGLSAPPIPPLRSTRGWREVPIEPVAEPMVRVAELGGRVLEEPAYHRMGLPGAAAACWLREGVAERLARVAAGLPRGMMLLVWDGWRALETQTALFTGYAAELTGAHPGWSRAAVEEAAARFVSPPSPAPACPSPHLTGGAVDLTLADADGRPLDLGTPFDAFVPEAAARALEDGRPPGIDPAAAAAARERRRTLFWAMHGQGFTAYEAEWWHYDHGDQFWGLAAGRPARYGPAPDPRRPPD
jgi:zinc D-Ala-D-Ala dipeptidase